MSGMKCHLYMWSLTVLGLLAAATIFNVLGMVGLSLIVIYSGAYNKCKTIQTPVGRGGNDGKGKKNKCLGIYSEMVSLLHPPTIVKELGIVGLSFSLLMSVQQMQNCSNTCRKGW